MGLERKIYPTPTTNTTTTSSAIAKGATGGRVRLALSNSSVMGTWPASKSPPGLGKFVSVMGASSVELQVQLTLRRDVAHLVCWPVVFHRAPKVLFGKRVQHVFRGEPRAARLQNPVLDLLEMRGMVRVGVDYDLYSPVARHTQVYIIEIQAFRIGVQLHSNLFLGRGFQDRFEIELVGLAAQLQAACRVSKDGDVLVADCAKKAVSHL